MASHKTTQRSQAPGARPPSIARRLTVLLIFTVMLISTSVISLLYLHTVTMERRELNHKADEYIDYLVGALELPIWNFDMPTVELIGKTAAHNEVVVRLVIRGVDGPGQSAPFFSYDETGRADVVERRAAIAHEGEPIGELELAVTKRLYQKDIAKLLLVFAFTILVILVSISVVCGVLVKAFLKKPLVALNNIVDAYASGTPDRLDTGIPYREFQPFASVLERQLRELRAAEEKYRSIFENSLDGIFQTTPEGTLLSANPAIARFLGFASAQEFMSSVANVAEQIYVQPEDRQTFLRLLEQNGEVNQFQVQMRRADGALIWAELSARAERNEAGKIVLIEGILNDITAEKRAAEERLALEQQLQQSQRIEALGKLAGGIAHDFNNLLQAMSGYIQLLLLRKDLEKTVYKYLQQIDKTMDRASVLIGRLLTFSRKMDIDFQPVSLNEIIGSTLQLMERTVPKMVAMQTRLDPDLAVIQADPLQMEQVLVNLITNSVDAMAGSGTITIETQNFVLDQVHTGTYPELSPGDYILVTVADTGAGMDDETRQRIFEPFFTTKKTGEGTGLGLSTVYGIIKGHRGQIRCSSEPGTGTTFTLFLPVVRKEHEELPEKQHQAVTDIVGGSETILLVDDEPIIVEIAQKLLESLGYTVKKAASGEEALALYSSEKNAIDLVIIDLNMPGIGGEKCVEELRVRDPQAKIIVASGYAEHRISKAPLTYGLAGFIAKPYRLDKLAMLVRQVLDNA